MALKKHGTRTDGDTMTVFALVIALGKAVIWMGAYAELLGMPVAWLRVRGSPAWNNRPAGSRRIDLLASFILKPTVVAILWGWLILVVAALGGLGLSGGALLVLGLGGPLIFVPWAVLQLDASRFSHLVEEARLKHERNLANKRP